MNIKNGEQKRIGEVDSFRDFLNKVEKDARWVTFLTNEATFVPLSDAPIIVASLRKELPITLDPNDKRRVAVSEETSDETLVSTMANTKCCLMFPEGDKLSVLPIAETALRGTFARIGLDCAVTTSLSENSRREEASPFNKGLAYEALKKYTKGKTILRVADEMIRANMSEEYVMLPANEIFRKSEEILYNKFERVDFEGGLVSHETTSFEFEIFDANLENAVFDAFNKVKVDVSGYGFFIKVLTSDVGLSGINVYTFLRDIRNGKVLNVSLPKKLEHRGLASIEMFEDNLKESFDSFTEFEKFLDEMHGTKILNPADCLYNIGSKAGLVEKGLKKAAEEFDGMFPRECNALDIYIALSDCFEDCLSQKASELAKMQAKETFMSCMLKNVKKYDEPTVKIGIHA